MTISKTNLYHLEEMFPQVSKTDKLHSLIVYDQIEKGKGENKRFIERLSLRELNRPATLYKLTPLHLAVIKGNKAFTEYLIKKGVELASRDLHGWTPLHHAIVTENHEIEMLLLQSIDSKFSREKAIEVLEMKTDRGQCFLDLARVLSYRPESLTKPEAISIMQEIDPEFTFEWPRHVFNYVDKNGEIVKGTPAEFLEQTNVCFTSKLITPPQVLIDRWRSEAAKKTVVDRGLGYFLKKQYLETKGSLPSVYIKRNEKISQQGVYASQTIEPLQIISIVGGVKYAARNSKLNKSCTYLGKVDGEKFRNIAYMINDGFPNVFYFKLKNVDGHSSLPVIVSSKRINEGEELLINYGPERTKRGLYKELRPDLMNEFLAKQDLLELNGQILNNQEFKGKDGAQVARCLEFFYLLDTPTVFLRAVLEERIPDHVLRSICKESFFKKLISNEVSKVMDAIPSLVALKRTKNYPDFKKWLIGLFDKYKVLSILAFIINIDIYSVAQVLDDHSWEEDKLGMEKYFATRDICSDLINKLDQDNYKEIINYVISCSSTLFSEDAQHLAKEILMHIRARDTEVFDKVKNIFKDKFQVVLTDRDQFV